MNIYGHHPSKIQTELDQIRKEKARAELRDRKQFHQELYFAMAGRDRDLERITRRISLALFTSKMMNVGERIIRELGENGRPVGD